MRKVLRRNSSGFLPEEYDVAHDLCLVLHDILLQLLKSGQEGHFFTTSIPFRDDADRTAFSEAADLFEWLEVTRRTDERVALLVTTVFPAILSDMLHCIYEALEASRKAKLNVTYMLIRKPLQENLFLLESIVVNRAEFAQKLVNEPLKLRGLKAGGIEAHADRIGRALGIVNERDRLSASYLAQLRYDKNVEDGFDGICNHAMHLFTEHKAIRTEPMNINFVFSGWEEKRSQWSFLYSRLPYVLFYVHRLVENIAETIAPTHPEYLDDMERRICALVVLWWRGVGDVYRTSSLQKFADGSEKWLVNHCIRGGYRVPTVRDLRRISRTGAYPGECVLRVRARNLSYSGRAAVNRRRQT